MVQCMNLKKMWNIGRLILCRDGYARAEYIKKKGLFGAMGGTLLFSPVVDAGRSEIYLYGKQCQGCIRRYVY